MKFIFLIIGFSIGYVQVFAQEEREQPQGETPAVAFDVRTNRIYGKLVDKVTGKPVEAASVRLYPLEQAKRDSLLTGMLSRPNGDFSFPNLSKDRGYRIVVSALGYKEWEEEVLISAEEGGRSGKFEKDMGNIELESEVKQLGTVTVTANRPALQLGIDRRVFNVDKSLTAAGGTAVDIMRNIPSLSVDIDGNVELRNSTPQLFVDGRPTILTLDQIPADHIERVELITNPSARFDAASSGGIINVVLKKNKRIGLNGLASLSGGTPEVFSSNLNLNYREGKLNFFASAGYNRSGGRAKGETNRQNKQNGVVTDYFDQYTINRRSRQFYSVRFGFDYFIDNRSTLTVSQNFAGGRSGNDESQNQQYLDNAKTLVYYGIRESDGRSDFSRKSSRLSYVYKFPKEGQELSADISYNYGNRSGRNDIFNSYFFPDGSVYQPDAVVWNLGDSREDQVTFQTDYTNPINERSKIEAGLRVFHNKFVNYYDAFADDNGQPSKLPLSNNYEYIENVDAAYVTYSSKNKEQTFSYQLGLRAEYSKFDGRMLDSAFTFGYEYPEGFANIWNSLFPSFFISQKVSENNELQFNYTRRIRRPRFWQLNPFIDINDPVNLRQGNPELRPEFINSFELNYSRNYGQGGNFLGVLYFRNNPNDITEYSDTITAAQYQQLNNAAVDPNAILNTYINASTTNRYGAEFTLQHKIGKNFDITPSLDLQYRTTNANVDDLQLSNEGFNWEAKLIVNYKIETTDPSSFFNNFGFQFSGEYEAPRVIPQGRTIAEYDADVALRKDFLKERKATITFAVNDVFNSRRWGTIYDTEQFYQDSYRRWGVRTFRLTFSYKFGDANFTLSRRNADRDDD